MAANNLKWRGYEGVTPFAPLTNSHMEVLMAEQNLYQDQESWKPISGYENLYSISDHGRALSILKNKILCPIKTSRGYFQYELTKDKFPKKFLAHRIVISEFLGKSELPVNHKNRDKSDNRLENLEYTTVRENNIHSRKSPREYIGVGNYKNKSWYADITIDRKRIRIGTFDTNKEASEAYQAYIKARDLLGDFNSQFQEKPND